MRRQTSVGRVLLWVLADLLMTGVLVSTLYNVFRPQGWPK